MPAWKALVQNRVLDTHTFKGTYLMRPAFTTRTACTSDAGWTEEMQTVFRTAEPADGIITNRQNVAIGMMNGDCPAAIIYNESMQQLALLHCGFRCLVPQGDNAGIFETFFSSGAFEKKRAKIRLAYGIGPCCYGFDTMPECGDNARVKSFPKSTATSGPRAGKQSIDLYALMRLQLKSLGLREDQIVRETMPQCTACKMTGPDNSREEYHSNVYDGAEAGRNLVLAWME